MKKRRFLFFPFFLLFLSVAAFPSGLSFGFRFTGGMFSMSGGDLNTGMAGLSEYYSLIAEAGGMDLSGEFQDLHWGFHGGGDLLVSFAPWIGLEVGGGYFSASKESIVAFEGIPDEGRWTIKPSASIVPLRAGLFFLAPLGSGLSLSVHGGAVYALASVETSFRIESVGTDYWRLETQKSTAAGIGFYGGLGLEIRIAPGVFFLVEAQGQGLRLDGFEGDLNASYSFGATEARSGTLYDFDLDLPSGFSESKVNLLYIYEDAPSGYGLTNVRPAKVDFGGFGFAAGFVIRL